MGLPPSLVQRPSETNKWKPKKALIKFKLKSLKMEQPYINVCIYLLQLSWLRIISIIHLDSIPTSANLLSPLLPRPLHTPLWAVTSNFRLDDDYVGDANRMMVEEWEAAEVIRKQRAISFAPRTTPIELPDLQIEGADRGEKEEC